MKGMPKTFNSKKDVEFCLNYWPEMTKDFLQKIKDSRKTWLIDHKMDLDETGVEDETHKVTEIYDENDNLTEKYQMIWDEDPNARLFRLGYTVEEVDALLGG